MGVSCLWGCVRGYQANSHVSRHLLGLILSALNDGQQSFRTNATNADNRCALCFPVLLERKPVVYTSPSRYTRSALVFVYIRPIVWFEFQNPCTHTQTHTHSPFETDSMNGKSAPFSMCIRLYFSYRHIIIWLGARLS